MIHPHTELRHASDAIGDGVFASAFIPKGTLVYVMDPLEIDLSRDDYEALPAPVREMADKYSYIDARGHRILSWDTAKYVNHSCDPNTMSSGYGFEIAIRDIHAGEEITDEYGLFNLERSIACHCGSALCRGSISGTDIDMYYQVWDRWVMDALESMRAVEQPLWRYVEKSTRRALRRYLETGKGYRSTLGLKIRARRAVPAVTTSVVDP